MQGIIGPDLKSRYEHVLKGFLNTPADRKPEMRRIYTLIMMMLLSGCILEMTCPRIRYNRQLVRSVCLPSHFPFRHRAANSDGV